MRALLITFGTLVVLLLAVVLIAPSFVDWNSQKNLITEEARRITGRSLAIDGDVELSLLPAPALSAKGVRLANLRGGTAPAMVELEALRVRVAFMPLLRGRVQVVSVSLVEPRILLEVLPDGRRNWEFNKSSVQVPILEEGQTAPPASATSGSADDRDFTVQVDSFAIQDGVVVYRDARDGTEERIEELNGTLVAESLDGPYGIEGTARLRGVETNFDFAVGRMVGSGATPLNVELELPNAKASATFSGSLSLDPNPIEMRGRLKGEGESLASVIAAIAQSDNGLPAVLENSFKIDTNVSMDREGAALTEAELGLGTTSLSGNAQLRFGPPVDIALRLNVPRLDLDGLLAGAADVPAGEIVGETTGETSSEQQSAAPTTAAGTAAELMGADLAALLNEFEGSVNLTVDALIYRQQVVRQLRLSTGLAGGRLEINQAHALLPGGSDLSLTGSLANGDGPPLFDGHIEAASDNLRGVFDWLGIDVGGVPQDRLRKASLSSGVQATPQQVTLSDIDLRVDLSRVAGGIVVAVRDRLGLGIGLSVDNLNLDAYLPKSPGAKTPGPQDAGGAPSEGPSASTEAAAEGSGAVAGPLGAFDANVNLRLGSLRWYEQTARDLRLEGTLRDGKLTLREASLADLAGSSLRYMGEIDGLGGQPAIDGLVEMKVGDPARLARAFGLDGAELDRIGSFNLTANLEGAADDLGINSKLAVLGGRFDLSGRVQALAAPPRFALQLEAAHPLPVELAETFAGPLGLPPSLGPLDIKASIAGSPQDIEVSDLDGKLGPLGLSGGFGVDRSGAAPRLRNLALGLVLKDDDVAALGESLGFGAGNAGGLGGVNIAAKLGGDLERLQLRDLSGTIGPLGLAGSLDADLSGAKPQLSDYNLNLHLRHPDVARLSQALDGPSLDPRLGGIDLKGHLIGTAEQLTLEGLDGKLGESAIAGQVRADLSGARPRIAADLTTGELPLHLLLAAEEGASGSGGAGSGGSGSLSPRWSQAPIDLAPLQTFDGDFKMKSRALLFDDLRLDESDLQASLSDGHIELQRLTGEFFKGRLQVAGAARTATGVSADFTLAASNVELGDLLRATADSDRVSGPVNLNAKLRTQGQSEAELVSGLAGNGDIGGSLLLSAKVEEQLGAALLDVLGQKVREVRGVSDATNTVFAAFAGSPAALTGTFSVEQGVLRTVDTRLEGRDAYALTHANIDLPAWRMSSTTELFRAGDERTPYLTASLNGPIDEPNVRISGVPLQQRKAPEAAPAPSDQAPESQQPSDQAPEPLDPKKLLKGLLKGLGN